MNKLIWIATLRIIAIVGQLIFIKLFTNFLTVDKIGYFYYYATISYFLNALIFIPYDYFQQAEIFKLDKNNFNLKILKKINSWLAAFVFLSAVIAMLFFNKQAIIVILIIFSAFTLYLSTASKTFLNNHDEQLLVVGTMLLEVLVKVVVFFVLIDAGFPGPESVMLAMILSQLSGVLLLSVKVLKHTGSYNGADSMLNTNKLVSFCYPLSFSSILNWLQLQGYRLVLVPLGYAESVGVYAAISSIGGTGVNSTATVYQQVFQPKVYQTNGGYIGTYLKWGLLMILGVFIVGMTLRDYIVELVSNDSFIEYASIIGFGVLIDSGNFLIGALVVYLSIHGKIRILTKSSIFGFIVLLLSFFVLWAADTINVYTIGVPLLISQYTIVVLLYYKSGIFSQALKRWRTQRINE